MRSAENQREGTEDTAREANVTAVSLLILIPWLVFAAGLVTIGFLGFGFDRVLLLLRERLLWWEARGNRVDPAGA